jgi:hypothetical protein
MPILRAIRSFVASREPALVLAALAALLAFFGQLGSDLLPNTGLSEAHPATLAGIVLFAVALGVGIGRDSVGGPAVGRGSLVQVLELGAVVTVPYLILVAAIGVVCAPVALLGHWVPAFAPAAQSWIAGVTAAVEPLNAWPVEVAIVTFFPITVLSGAAILVQALACPSTGGQTTTALAEQPTHEWAGTLDICA